MGAGIGVWLSPWGGYGQAKEERLQAAAREGYETNAMGFSLAGPKVCHVLWVQSTPAGRDARRVLTWFVEPHLGPWLNTLALP